MQPGNIFVSGWLAFAVVALGGAVGASARYAISVWLAGSATRFPWATLLANLSGALLAGFIVTVISSRGLGGSGIALLLVTGFLGSYTTLSAFSVETLRLMESGLFAAALANLLATVAGALLAVVLGSLLARVFTSLF